MALETVLYIFCKVKGIEVFFSVLKETIKNVPSFLDRSPIVETERGNLLLRYRQCRRKS